ncbi:DUF6597 domain-containing transcriptional factor [Streptomyces massasporeus]|uniref:DUF6597 domain-containing transcriptional factor n=1 Tax=Streptomyces massasporeus TaxID=67324 RepID=UPI0036BCE14B
MARKAGESPVALTMRPSVPALGAVIGAMGCVEGRFAHSAELALPTGGAQLLVNLDGDALSSSPLKGAHRRTGGAALHGPYSEPTVIDPAQQQAVLWVAFRPAGVRPFLDAPPSQRSATSSSASTTCGARTVRCCASDCSKPWRPVAPGPDSGYWRRP